jgi:hypothetical protein
MNKRAAKVGQAAAKMVAGLKRAQWLPHYDRATLRDVVAEMGELFKHLHHNLDMNRMEGANTSRTATITFLDTALRRNRQCVLAYLNFRLEKIRDLTWQHISNGDELPDPIKERLDQDELKYARLHHAALLHYMSEFNTNDFSLDLMTDYLPPKGTSIEVELKSYAMGRAYGSRFLARRQDVEHLILNGAARHINADGRSGAQLD